MEDLIGAGGRHFGPDLGHALEQTHDKACGYDGGKDRNEYVAQSLDHSERKRLLLGGCRLDVSLCRGGHAAD